MADFKKSNEVRDYKELFEFRLTVGDNIICQRYFRINNFKVESLKSLELVDTIRNCARVIDRDLQMKTQIYLSMVAPKMFDSVEEMTEYFKNPLHASEMHYGEGIVVRDSAVDYFWGNTGVEVCPNKFDNGEFYTPLTEEDKVMYKFAFLIDGNEVCSTVWAGVYPKYIRNSIDLSNKRGKFEGEDLSRLSFEQYLLYKLVEGRSDLVWGLIKDICETCSYDESEDDYYTTSLYGYENKYERVITGVNDPDTLARNRRYNKRKQEQRQEENK